MSHLLRITINIELDPFFPCLCYGLPSLPWYIRARFIVIQYVAAAEPMVGIEEVCFEFRNLSRVNLPSAPGPYGPTGEMIPRDSMGPQMKSALEIRATDQSYCILYTLRCFRRAHHPDVIVRMEVVDFQIASAVNGPLCNLASLLHTFLDLASSNRGIFWQSRDTTESLVKRNQNEAEQVSTIAITNRISCQALVHPSTISANK